MNQSSNYQKITGKSAIKQYKKSGESSPHVKAFRAITAIVVFGIPLVAGTAAILSYAVTSVYKRMKGSL